MVLQKKGGSGPPDLSGASREAIRPGLDSPSSAGLARGRVVASIFHPVVYSTPPSPFRRSRRVNRCVPENPAAAGLCCDRVAARASEWLSLAPCGSSSPCHSLALATTKSARPFKRAACLITLLFAAFASAAEIPANPGWPEIRRENKPWTRWWWPGSAVDEANLTRQLESFARAGLGGVEITPIYGARGYEERYIDFLSPRWMELLAHTGREAQRLSLGVDLATGTGWPFGGPWITEADALKKIIFQDGKLAGEPTRMMVKRAAPGDEGLVLDPYSTAAIRHYLAPFSRAFASFPHGLVRAQFHDSFEYYNAGWTPTLPQVFREMHGYDLAAHAAELMEAAPASPETLSRLKGDYRATLARLHYDYLSEWARWSHAHGFLVRNQSHGAPANLLDLYGAVDIPETEIFGSTPFPIPGLRRETMDVRTDMDLPEPLVIRLASSAAHVMGHPLASSETCTWLREHWRVALAFAKPEIDRLFACGINHLFYHGTVYSPQDAPWPGWLFYASTQFNPNNPWWDDFSALNTYVARVQSVLQAGRPDNDVLLYWPFADALDDPAGLMKQFSVHEVKWLTAQPVGALAGELLARGYSLDYVSDAQLLQTRVDGGALVTSGGTRYRALVIPRTRRMPVETLEQLLTLARAGATVIFADAPEDVPGLGRLAERRTRFKQLLASPELARIAKDTDVLAALAAADVPREPAAETGVSFIRRASELGHDYFFANLTDKPFDGWLTLGTSAHSTVLLDPLTGHAGIAALRSSVSDSTTVGGVPSKNGIAVEVYLQLAPGESLILRTCSAPNYRSLLAGAPGDPSPAGRLLHLDPWPYSKSADRPILLEGKWSINFIKGGPDLPPAIESDILKSWTELGGEEAQRFAGTARYRIEFTLPSEKTDGWLLDLGDVRESARVRVNGRDVATAWSRPLHVRVGEFLKPGRNVLELDVTNLAANRIRDLDRRGVKWKIMREINFVDIHYQPFDASPWPLAPSGLLGPVALIPLQNFDPAAKP